MTCKLRDGLVKKLNGLEDSEKIRVTISTNYWNSMKPIDRSLSRKQETQNFRKRCERYGMLTYYLSSNDIKYSESRLFGAVITDLTRDQIYELSRKRFVGDVIGSEKGHLIL